MPVGRPPKNRVIVPPAPVPVEEVVAAVTTKDSGSGNEMMEIDEVVDQKTISAAETGIVEEVVIKRGKGRPVGRPPAGSRNISEPVQMDVMEGGSGSGSRNGVALRARTRSTAGRRGSAATDTGSTITPTPSPMAPSARHVLEVVVKKPTAAMRKLFAPQQDEAQSHSEMAEASDAKVEDKDDHEVKVRTSARMKQKEQKIIEKRQIREIGSMNIERQTPPSSNEAGGPRRNTSSRRSMHLPLTPTSQTLDSPPMSPSKPPIPDESRTKRSSSSVPSELPPPGTSTITGHGTRSNKSSSLNNAIPFPADGELSKADKKRGCLVDEDLADEKLMAICAALDFMENRALTAQEIGEVCLQQGWMRSRYVPGYWIGEMDLFADVLE